MQFNNFLGQVCFIWTIRRTCSCWTNQWHLINETAFKQCENVGNPLVKIISQHSLLISAILDALGCPWLLPQNQNSNFSCREVLYSDFISNIWYYNTSCCIAHLIFQCELCILKYECFRVIIIVNTHTHAHTSY